MQGMREEWGEPCIGAFGPGDGALPAKEEQLNELLATNVP